MKHEETQSNVTTLSDIHDITNKVEDRFGPFLLPLSDFHGCECEHVQ